MIFNNYALLVRRSFSKSRLSLFGALWIAAFIFLTPKYVHAPEEHTLVHRPIPPTSNMDIFAPTLDPSEWRSWITENAKTTHALLKCIELSNCGQNQTKVVIFDSHHFRLILEGEWTGGEGIWATSTLRALKNMGYSVLITGDIERTIQMYHIFHHFVVMVVSEPEKTTAFWAHDLVRSPTNPGGIPVWKLFEFQFWGQSINPLGPQWTLNPEDYQALVGRGYPQNTYLGYSIEAQCSKLPFIPHSKRNREIWVIAKTLVYFHPDLRAWAPDFFDLAANSTGVSFATGTGEPLGSQQKSFRVRESDVASSIANLGPLVQDDFSFLLSHSLVVVGMGDPMFSPTPYDALCLGVPLINPIKEWDRTNPSDRTRWRTQHDMLRHLSPPYVYHVFKGDREGFVQAIKDAIDHPIQSYVLERMTMSAVENRLGKILEHDWRAEAADVLRQRKESGNGRLFIL